MAQHSDVLRLPLACIPEDHSRQTSAARLAERSLGEGTGPRFILDLGCGEGHSVDLFRRLSPSCRWVGVDIAHSPEVQARRRTDAEFRSFDGIHIPADDASVDLVFCNQAITHAEHPLDLLRDVRRILKPAGHLIGSTSYLEPMMSYAKTNFTPYGLFRQLELAGLKLQEIRPGIDSLTLILRRLLWKRWLFDRFYETESPLNRLIGFAGRVRGRSAREINARKILFAGQFVFRAGIS